MSKRCKKCRKPIKGKFVSAFNPINKLLGPLVPVEVWRPDFFYHPKCAVNGAKSR